MNFFKRWVQGGQRKAADKWYLDEIVKNKGEILGLLGDAVRREFPHLDHLKVVYQAQMLLTGEDPILYAFEGPAEINQAANQIVSVAILGAEYADRLDAAFEKVSVGDPDDGLDSLMAEQPSSGAGNPEAVKLAARVAHHYSLMFQMDAFDLRKPDEPNPEMLETSLRFARHAVELDSQPAYCATAAQTLLFLARAPEALPFAEYAVENAPFDDRLRGEYHRVLGLCDFGTGNLARAESCFQVANTHTPGLAVAELHLVQEAMRQAKG